MKVLTIALLLVAGCGTAATPDVLDGATNANDATTADALDATVAMDTQAMDVQPDRACAPCTDPRCRGCSDGCCIVFDDAGTDAGADTVSRDAIIDEDALSPQDAAVEDTAASDASAPVDVGSDAAVDAPSCDMCIDGALQCAVFGTASAVQRCQRNAVTGCLAWAFADTCSSTEVCYRQTCSACRPGDGSACGPWCRDDADCANAGYAQCTDGYCARRGYLRCAGATDCNVFRAGAPTPVACVSDTIGGVMERICDGRQVGPCRTDANCPRGFVCDAASGYCRR